MGGSLGWQYWHILFFVVLGLKPRAPSMLEHFPSKCLRIEQHPQPLYEEERKRD
jgi:hypothetical protein